MTVTPPYTSARADLAALTQERIMRGLADLLTSGRDVPFRALAAASGVPERTAYRHYASKEALFSAFWRWLNERLGMPATPKSPQELIDQVPALFAAFESGEPLVRAMLHDPHGRATRLATTAARRTRLNTALEEVLEVIAPSDRTRLLASVQVLISAAGWETMKDYRGLTTAEAADAAQWAIRTLIAEAHRHGRSPRRPSSSGDQRPHTTTRPKE
jgi:AcrR family transcriptional regulator